MAGLRRFGSVGIPQIDSEERNCSPVYSCPISTNWIVHSKSAWSCSPSTGSTSSFKMHIASASSNSLPLIKLTLILIKVSSFFNGWVTTAKK